MRLSPSLVVLICNNNGNLILLRILSRCVMASRKLRKGLLLWLLKHYHRTLSRSFPLPKERELLQNLLPKLLKRMRLLVMRYWSKHVFLLTH